MKSRWFDLKEAALALRKAGLSITIIETTLGVPRSTLSGWLRDVPLTEEQKRKLSENKAAGWQKARTNAAASRKNQKNERQQHAEEAARTTLKNLSLTNELLDLALAMFYAGGGSPANKIVISHSDPKILIFVLSALKRNYSVANEAILCSLRLHRDQEAEELKKYWAQQLRLEINQFRLVTYKRGSVKPTNKDDKGVCTITCTDIAIQRKLMYLYNLFCQRVSDAVLTGD